MTLLGLDIGTSFGWCALRKGDPLLRVGDTVRRLGSGVWDLGGGSDTVRLLRLRTHLDALLAQGQVEAVAYELVHRHMGTEAAHVYGGLVGVVHLACADAGLPPPVGLGVGQVKLHLAGSGNASKAAMCAAAVPHLGRQPLTDDEADALGVALLGLERLTLGPLAGTGSGRVVKPRAGRSKGSRSAPV